MALAEKERSAIITAIRVLRTRRVRPSSDKIMWYIRRENLLTEAGTKHALAEMVKNREVHEVEYKGGVSYRLASEHRAPSAGGGRVRSKYDGLALRHALLTTIATKGGTEGLTEKEILTHLTASGFAYTEDRVRTILQREVRLGAINWSMVSKNGYFSYVYVSAAAAVNSFTKDKKASDTPSTPASGSDSGSDGGADDSSGSTPFESLHRHLKLLKEGFTTGDRKDKKLTTVIPPPEGGLKSSKMNEQYVNKEIEYQRLLEESNEGGAAAGGSSRRGRPRKAPTMYGDVAFYGKKPRVPSQRMKRARKVFDPSESIIKKRISTESEEFQPVLSYRCDVCFQANANNVEDLLICCSCSARAHPGCLGYNTELAIKSRLGPWTCMDCKHCSICDMDHNIGTLIFCDKCDRAYHLTCHNPPLDEQPNGSWICFCCIPNAGQKAPDYISGFPTPSSSPTLDENSRGSSGSSDNAHLYDPQIPNASNWTVDNVVNYFKEKGFEKYCKVFKEQDIDGTALLMLTRMDVLTGLNIKLGPALKIYRQVRILQTRNPNPPVC